MCQHWKKKRIGQDRWWSLLEHVWRQTRNDDHMPMHCCFTIGCITVLIHPISYHSSLVPKLFNNNCHWIELNKKYCIYCYIENSNLDFGDFVLTTFGDGSDRFELEQKLLKVLYGPRIGTVWHCILWIVVHFKEQPFHSNRYCRSCNRRNILS